MLSEISPDRIWTMPAEAAETVTLSDAVAFLRRQFWLIAGTTAAALALAVLYVVLTPAGYLASAQLLIEPGKQQALWQDRNLVDLTIDNAQVESQVAVLQSERIANHVIAGLGLADDPEFRPDASGTDYERQRIALSHFEGALSARRMGESYVIQVSFRSRDPAKAARVANAVVAAYLRDQQEAKSDVAKQANQWMEDRIADLGVELNAAAAAVQEFRVAHGIVDTAARGTPPLIDRLTELEARAQAYRRVYETFLEKLTENQQQTSYPIANARVITPASRPLIKTYPKTGLVLLLAVFAGAVIGIAVAAARAMLDGSVQSAKQARQALALPCLGVLPACRARPRRHVEVVDAPSSPFSDAVHNVKISLQHACRRTPSPCIGILSLLPGEGASTVALNLAASFAAADTKTLLIDADFRDRGLTRRLAPGAVRGLVEALREGRVGETKYDPKTRTHLLPLAVTRPLANSADLLDSGAMLDLLPQLKEQFATILIDLPALSRAVDARAVAPLVDGCILVAAYGRTPLRALEDAVALLRSDGVALLGIVITAVPEGIQPLFGLHLGDYWKRRGFRPARVGAR